MTNNFFLARLFDWHPQSGRVLRALNFFLRRRPLRWQLSRVMDSSTEMTNLLQRVNLYHLAARAAPESVPGDFVELGCYDGRTAVIFARVLREASSSKTLHLFDHFQVQFGEGKDIRRELDRNFSEAAEQPPVLHPGDFRETVPSGLPDLVSFAHIDCGFGGDPNEHRETVLFCLAQLYPRLSPGAICILMDYHLPENPGPDYNPGATQAADAFLTEKPETITALWAGEACHAYFVKAAGP